MSRGRYPRRLKVKPPDAAALQRYLLHWPSGPLYRSPDSFPQVSSQELFGDRAPLELEVGCGTGEFLLALAGRSPGVNFLGIEIAMKPLYRAVQRARDLALGNVKFIKADFRLVYPRLVPGSLRAVYLHYPVPVRRRKHAKRRIVDDRFLEQVVRALQVGGRLSLMTDEASMFAEICQVVLADGRLAAVDPSAYRFRMEGPLKSHNQQIWESRGRFPQRLVVEKRPEVGGEYG